MSDEHKAALAAGRTQGKAVRDYLEALEVLNAPKRRRRRRTPDSIRKRLGDIAAEFDTADVIKRLSLVQEQIDLEDELAQLEAQAEPVDITDLEAKFIEVAAAYSESKGIVYAAWRSIGVPPKVLRAAGIRK